MLVILITIATILSLSFYFETEENKQQYEELALNTAKSYSNTIKTLRKWNAIHNGVYVPVTQTFKPNPYLKDDLRDLQTNKKDLYLTKVNPSYMTRLLSEIVSKEMEVQFHITSLKPINPNNSPDQWERDALINFNRGLKEKYNIVLINREKYFRYMEPLKVEKPCMKCHSQQGYKEGDIRGGLSFAVPYEPYEQGLQKHFIRSTFKYLVFFLFIALSVYIFGKKSLKAEIERQKLLQEIELSNQELEFLSRTDVLTELSNRRYVLERLTEEIPRAMRYKRPLTVMILDLDHFKQINDVYGHLTGDKVLQQVGKIILDSIRNIDIASRYGGDEFLIILPETTTAEANQIGRRIQEGLDILNQQSDTYQISITWGTAEFDGNSTNEVSSNWLISQADQKLYEAKRKQQSNII